MTLKEALDKSPLPKEITESVYWHSVFVQQASKNSNIDWPRLLFDVKYRIKGE